MCVECRDAILSSVCAKYRLGDHYFRLLFPDGIRLFEIGIDVTRLIHQST